MSAANKALIWCILITLSFVAIASKKPKIKIKKSTSWSIEPYLTPIPTRTQAAAILQDAIYLFGGQTYIDSTQSANREVFKLDLSQDEDTREWESVATISSDLMPEPWFASNQGASTLDNDEFGIYVTCEDSRIGNIWRFDIENDRFEFDIIATMQDLRNDGGINYKIEDCCSVAVGDNIYIIGGAQFVGRDPVTNAAIFDDVDYVQIYDTVNEEWSYGTSLPLGIQDATCEAVDDEYIYLFGGSNNDNVRDDVYRYDIVNDEWDEFEDVLSVERRSFGSVCVPNTDYIVLVGGDTGGQFSEEHEFLDLVEVYNVNTNMIDDSVELPQLNQGRAGGVTVIEREVKNGNKDEDTIYIVGGEFEVNVGVYDDTEALEFKVKY